jgi:hypothetical protein
MIMKIPTDNLINDLKQVYAEEGGCSYFTYCLAGSYAGTTILDRFDGSWNLALRQAGIPLSKLGRPRKQNTVRQYR